MAKTAASHVWHKGIKYRGIDGVLFIARCSDPGAAKYIGYGMMLADVDGELVLSSGPGTADHHDYSVSVGEELANTDRYFLAYREAGRILHNQKLAAGYKIGDAVYQSATGTWSYAKSSTGACKLQRLGFVVGPVDRITATVVKGIDDALTATEPVDILI